MAEIRKLSISVAEKQVISVAEKQVISDATKLVDCGLCKTGFESFDNHLREHHLDNYICTTYRKMYPDWRGDFSDRKCGDMPCTIMKVTQFFESKKKTL